MKTMKQIAAFTALAALTGCNPGNPSSGDRPTEPPAQTGAVIELPKASPVATLNRETPPVPPAAAAAADKAGFLSLTEQKLKDLDTKIDELAKKSESLKDDAKAQADQALAALRDQRAKLNEKFDELKKAGTEAWKELKVGFESVLNELEKAYENAKSKFS